jgi:DNA polymerase-3 subunit gamma/tau
VEYQALYRKYRPQTFSEIIGQEHVTATLAKEVLDGRVAHAYLFAGPRGTGKTTAARILAKALNCADRRADAEPCNVCTSCVAITEGNSLDVIELDAASHNSVDDIRDMRVSVSTVASTGGAKRVFILDEAHMLSKAAGNALLKTLEEPPEHVHFVLATTEPYKLLDTVRSRAQRFDFHSVPLEILVQHLDRISEAEGYRRVPGALMAVARHARGSVRDSLSLLEQVAALGDGSVEEAGVNRALGLADRDVYTQLGAAVADLDAKTALNLVGRLAADGVDLRRFVAEAISFFRGVFLVKYTPNVPEVVDESPEVVGDWHKVADELSAPDVLRILDILAETLMQLREGREERLMVELALLKLTRPEVASDPASLAARLEQIEQRLKRLAAAPAPDSASVTEEAAVPRVAAVEAPLVQEPAAGEATRSTTAAVEPGPPPEPVPEAVPVARGVDPVVTLLDFQSIWLNLIANVRDRLGSVRYALLREGSPGAVEGSVLLVHVPTHLGFHLSRLAGDEEVAAVVSAECSALLGNEVRVEFRAADDASAAAPVVEARGTERAPIPDKDELPEAPEEEFDPTSLVTDLLGGEVVEESDDG